MSAAEIPENGSLSHGFHRLAKKEQNLCGGKRKQNIRYAERGSEINRLIDDTPFITDLQKRFYKTMLRERKEKILDKSLELLKKRKRGNGAG